jgi:hypothetical protein
MHVEIIDPSANDALIFKNIFLYESSKLLDLYSFEIEQYNSVQRLGIDPLQARLATI